jgi:5'-nucleotidase / UDP-sugar diphosphatase
MMRLSLKSLYISVALFLTAAFLIIPGCAASNVTVSSLKDIGSPPLSITLLHVNDTHSYVIPHDIKLSFNGKDTLTTVGGWSLLMAAVEDIRGREKNVLLLHGGDVLEGTIWTTRFAGMTDIDAMNTLQFDALVPGNHDFSKGPKEAAALYKKAKFPVIAANMDVSQEPALAGTIKPYTLLVADGQKIGVIGLVTTDTEFLDYPGKNIVFSDPATAARKYIAELNKQGINKIIILSHLGYQKDVELAQLVAGIDIIVGGHTHTLMGGPEFEQIGLKPETPYPTELKGPSGDKVLVVQAWENNQMLGQIKLDFDDKGRISSYAGQPFIPAMNSFQLEDPGWGWAHLCSCRPEFGEIMDIMARNPGVKLYWDNADMAATLQPYINEISSELNTVVAVAGEDLYRGQNTGPGPIVADAFLWSARKADPNVQLAIYDSYNVRADIFRGDILLNTIQMVLPLRQTLAVMTVKGSDLKTLLETGVDSHLKAGMQPPYYEIAGFKMTMDMSHKSGDRISGLQVLNADGTYSDMNMDSQYVMTSTDYLADKGVTPLLNSFSWMGPLADNIKPWLKGYFKYSNTGIKDIDGLSDYLRIQKNIKNVTAERTVIIPAAAK